MVAVCWHCPARILSGLLSLWTVRTTSNTPAAEGAARKLARQDDACAAVDERHVKALLSLACC